MSRLDEAMAIAAQVVYPSQKQPEPAKVEEVKAETPVVEEVKVEAPVVEEKKDEFASNFEKITKQEKHNAEIRRQLEEKRKEFEADKADLERYRQFDKKLKEDPLEVLEKLGLSPERINKLLQDRSNPVNAEARQALERIQKLEKDLEARESKAKEEALAREDVKLNASIAETVKNKGYDIIEHFNKEKDVRAYMESHYDETGEILDIAVACEAVTKDLVSRITKSKSSKWLQEQIASKEEVVEKDTPKTLSNKMIQSSTKEVKPRNEAERLEAAIRILNGG